MARYITTSGSYFTPLSYDELIKPIQAMDTAHEKSLAAAELLGAEADTLDSQIVVDGDKNVMARHMLDNYNSKFNRLMDELNNNGVGNRSMKYLSDARTGFGDIQTLKNALALRQEASKNFGEEKRKDKTLVTSTDPIFDNLDDYIANQNAGNNWYSYSGAKLGEDVAADAKARINEFVTSTISSDIPGYITRKTFSTVTSSDIDEVVDAVRKAYIEKDPTALANLGEGTAKKAMADILTENLDATGAYGRVDADEFDRLIGYGGTGLGEILNYEKSEKDLSDKVWEINQEEAAAIREDKRKRDFEEWKWKLQHPDPDPSDVNQDVNMGSYFDYESPGYKDLVKNTKIEDEIFRDESGNPISIPVNIDGRQVQVVNTYDLTDKIYNLPVRESIRKNWGGIDIALGTDKQEAVIGNREVFTGKLSREDADRLGLDRDNAIGLYYKDENGKKHLHESGTNTLSRAYAALNARIEKIKSDNAQLDIDKHTISPEKQKKMRDDYDYPETASWSDFYNYATAVETKMRQTELVLAGSDLSHNGYATPALASAFEHQWNNDMTSTGGDPGTATQYAVYKVGKGGIAVEKEGVSSDIDSILGLNSNNKPNFSSIHNITVTPWGAADENPKIRFQSKAKPGETFEVDSHMFGPLVSENMRNNQPLISAALFPVLKPKDVIRMSDEESMESGELIYSVLKRMRPMAPAPTRTNSDGSLRPATAKEIMLSVRDREMVTAIVSDYINNTMLDAIREVITREHEQYKGNSRQKDE